MVGVIFVDFFVIIVFVGVFFFVSSPTQKLNLVLGLSEEFIEIGSETEESEMSQSFSALCVFEMFLKSHPL